MFCWLLRMISDDVRGVLYLGVLESCSWSLVSIHNFEAVGAPPPPPQLWTVEVVHFYFLFVFAHELGYQPK